MSQYLQLLASLNEQFALGLVVRLVLQGFYALHQAIISGLHKRSIIIEKRHSIIKKIVAVCTLKTLKMSLAPRSAR